MRELTKYSLNAAAERLAGAEKLTADGHFKDSVNRSYYAMFSATRALLSEAYTDFKKHLAVISYFRREYIKTGLLDVKLSDYIGKDFDARNDCDYEDFFIASREQAEVQYQHAFEFVVQVEKYLTEENPNDTC